MSDLNPCCILCGSCLLRKNDGNLVDGKGSFVPREELEKLAFVVYSSDARHVCRNCFELLKKRKSIRESLDSLNEKLLTAYKNCCAKSGRGIKLKGQPAKRALFSEPEARTSGPGPYTAPSVHVDLGRRVESSDVTTTRHLKVSPFQPTIIPENICLSPICSASRSDSVTDDKDERSTVTEISVLGSGTESTFPDPDDSDPFSPTFFKPSSTCLTTPSSTHSSGSVVVLSSTVEKSKNPINKDGTSLKSSCSSVPSSVEQRKQVIILQSLDPGKGIKKCVPKAGSCQELNKTNVVIKIEWPCKTKERYLPEDLHQIGKMLCRGTYKQIANAVWRHLELRQNILQCIAKELDKECSGLCSIKQPSCLRETSKQQMLNFSFEEMDRELQGRAPLLRMVLRAASLRQSKKMESDLFLLPATCMAASICLKNRSPHMTALQLLVTIILQHSGMMVSIKLMYCTCSICNIL